MCLLDTVFSMRLIPEDRKAAILKAAVAVAETLHYKHMTRGDIAVRAGVSPPLVTHYLGEMSSVQAAIMIYAVEHEVLKVISQGLLDGNPFALKASDELKAKAKESLPW